MRKAFQNSLLVSLICLVVVSCKEAEPAELIRFQNLSFGPVVDNETQVRGEALLYNPNAFGVSIKEIQLQIEVESTKVASLREAKVVKAGGKKEFVVPFQGTLIMADIQKIVEKQGLAYLLGKKVPLRFTGEIKTSIAGWSSKYPVDVKEEVSLGKLFSK
jgi:LEA14-like dessication related protein